MYPRPLTLKEIEYKTKKPKPEIAEHTNLMMTDSPVMQISSTHIRHLVKTGKNIEYLVTEPVRKYIDEMNFYREL